jgi:radical SAM-linked protein
MIYRPVRERDPEEILSTLVSAVDKGGYDEAAITSLSTADYSSVSPLVKRAMERLRPKKIALGISSLRAYGLDEDLLDEIASVKATGLTFAPEAGTQRMRDVINKNITEEDVFTTCHRVFARGWNRVKLYFMIGQPTEQDEDVVGIAEMGRQARKIGREYQPNVQVTVSVSSHVPKPHAPFQWCAMDSMEEMARKQSILREYSRRWRFNLRHHDIRVSHLEGIIGRGDYRTGALIERAWRAGARFDGWDERLDWEIWQKALDDWEKEQGVSRHSYLGTLPLDGRLPWDHIDVGLEEGFLAQEYKRALQGKSSPPCGKPREAKVHPTNLEDALADERKLICYHCGVACDLDQMREERREFLRKLGAVTKPERGATDFRQEALERIRKGKTPHDFGQGTRIRYRLRYSKLEPMNLRGHLDMVRVIRRVLRRAGLPLYYSEGFSPRPIIAHGPALALGMKSVAEYADITLNEDVPVGELLEALKRATESGLVFSGVRRLSDGEPSLSKTIHAVDVVALLPADGDVETRLQTYRERYQKALSRETIPVTVRRKDKTRTVDLKDVLMEASVEQSDSFAAASGVDPGLPAVRLRLRVGGASLRPAEIISEIFGETLSPVDCVRVHCWYVGKDGEVKDPLDPAGSRDDGCGEAAL